MMKKYDYRLWEDYINGMYNPPKDFIESEKMALKVFSDLDLFDSLCSLVIAKWDISCKENLLNSSLNKIAWMGQAALNINHKIPEIATKSAWKILDNNLQKKLNFIAEKNINEYVKGSKGLYIKMGKGLF